MSSYPQLLEYLFSLHTQNRGKLHLDAIQHLCNVLGNPEKAFKSIHVAGTNGKGSVCTLIAAGLASNSKLKVGLYTSPHISTFRERIKVNGEMISEEKTTELLEQVLQAAEKHHIPASFFELTTALAFLYFKEAAVDFAVIETGLGGRFDATNIIQPVLSIITSISLEHTELLGNTLDEIAHQKLGIAKPGIPLIIGPTVPKQQSIDYAASIGSPLYVVEEFFPDYRSENRAVALKAFEILGLPLPEELYALPPCRFEIHLTEKNLPIIFDVAHNPSGMQKLASLFRDRFPQKKAIVVIALSSSKDMDPCLMPLIPLAEQWYPVEAPNGRSYPVDAVCEALEKLSVGIASMTITGSITSAINKAMEQAERLDAPLLICGTFFIMGEARKVCGIVEPHDALDMNERALPRKS